MNRPGKLSLEILLYIQIILIVLLSSQYTFSHQVSDLEDTTFFRDGYFNFTVGAADLIGLGLGYQFDDDISVGIKWGSYWIASRGENHGGGVTISSGAGLGIRASHSLPFGVFNNLNFVIMPYYSTSVQSVKAFFKGAAFDLNIGHESKNKEGINFIWNIGVVINCAKRRPPLFMPNAKLGIAINF